MAQIKQLPPSVVNKIAAGEVIERPASVVKELLENSVDAGATHIDVTVLKGGTELVRVTDDGCGIAADELQLAIASHATSKINDADDLFHVSTLGFRGEALASIAEVSRLLLRSRTRDATAGIELEVSGGKAAESAPCGCGYGTTVEVRDLFFNTPVRQKFLRTTQTEMGHVSEAVTRLALGSPHIHFTLRHNERIIYDVPAVTDWRQRLIAFFGEELAAGLIPVESTDGDVRLLGYVADPNFSRGNNRMQYLFLNHRHIRDRSLGHALSEAYRGLLLSGRFPIAFLRLDMPPELVDVNVHPTKLEVRFQEGGRLYSQLLGTLRKKFLATDLTARIEPTSATELSDSAAAHDTAGAERQRRNFVDWAKGRLPQEESQGTESQGTESQGTESQGTESQGTESQGTAQQGTFDLSPASGTGLSLNRLDRSWAAAGPAPYKKQGDQSFGEETSWNDSSTVGEENVQQRVIPSQMAMQVHNRYLITEAKEGVVVIDQHALHERILYEQLRERVLSGSLETQRLLVPEPVSLTAGEAAAVLEAKELLEKLGIEVEPFGGDTILVSSYPAMLANLGPVEMLRQVVEQLLSEGKSPERRDLLDELLHMIACKAAIKAGDRLSPEEVVALVEQRHLCQDSHHCPHGRPTSLLFTREELDRRFKRI